MGTDSGANCLPPGGIEEFMCGFQTKTKPSFSIQGRLRITSTAVLFYANILGILKEEIEIKLVDIVGVQKCKTALIFPTAIKIRTLSNSYTFNSFLNRDQCHNLLLNVLKEALDKAKLADESPLSTSDLRRLAFNPNMYSTSVFGLPSKRRKSIDTLMQLEIISGVKSNKSSVKESANAPLQPKFIDAMDPNPPQIVVSECNTAPNSKANSFKDNHSHKAPSFKETLTRAFKFDWVTHDKSPPHEPETQGVESFDGFIQSGGLFNGGVSVQTMLQDQPSRRESVATNETNSSSWWWGTIKSTASSIRSPPVAKLKRHPFWSLNTPTDLNLLRRRGSVLKLRKEQQERSFVHQNSDDTLYVASTPENDALSAQHEIQEVQDPKLESGSYFTVPGSLPRMKVVSSPYSSLSRLKVPLKEESESDYGKYTDSPTDTRSPTITRAAMLVKPRKVLRNNSGSTTDRISRNAIASGSKLRRRSRSSGRNGAYKEAQAFLEAEEKKQVETTVVTNEVSEVVEEEGLREFIRKQAGSLGVIAALVVFCFCLLFGSLSLLYKVNTVLTQLESFSP
ncbi:hypothetical protein HDU79_005216 [Rhizoclosmatium sp. JEL0117]|nr:hypothetical protein HDU79_005216 [Rhizoclosmatium sp. JEL0117]